MEGINNRLIKLLMTILVSSFLIYIQVYFSILAEYLYFINLVIILICIFKFGIIDYRVGLLIFLLIYSLPVLNDVKFNSCENINELSGGQNICNAISDNFFYIINYLNSVELALISCLFNVKSYNKIDCSVNYNLIIIDLILVFIFILLVGNLNWQVINESYNLEGISSVVIIFYLLTIRAAEAIKIHNKLIVTLTYILLSLFFVKIGSRQFLMWAFIFLCISHHLSSKSRLSGLKIKDIIMGSLIISVLIFISLFIVIYRDKGNLYYDFIDNSYGIIEYVNLFVRLLYAETTYTFYNLALVIEYLQTNNSIGIYGLLSDLCVMIIPAALIDGKYSYINSYNIAVLHDLTPYGTWFIPGEFAVYFGGTIFVYFSFYLYLYLINFTVKILLYNKFISGISSYVLMYVFASIYIVRGSFIGGFKIFITLLFLSFIIKFIEKKLFSHNFGF